MSKNGASTQDTCGSLPALQSALNEPGKLALNALALSLGRLR